MTKYPSTPQFRDVIRNVKTKASFAGLDEEGKAIYKQVVFPTLKFFGTVKLHGTHFDVLQETAEAELIYQSREHIITPLNDNAGAASAMCANRHELMPYFQTLRRVFDVPADTQLMLAGEWCGGNVQKGVAINGLPKMMVVFAVRIGVAEESTWIRAYDPRFNMVGFEDLSDTTKIYSIGRFQTFEVDIDFNRPKVAQDILGKITEAVEAECPVGKFFGVSGIGEGVCWSSATPGWEEGSLFKVKGSAHSVSKVKVLASVDVEKVTKMKELVEVIMTENRMLQMVGVLKDRDGLDATPQNLGSFLKLCMQDALKEEMDTIIQNGFEVKEFGKYVSTTIRTWYLSQLEL